MSLSSIKQKLDFNNSVEGFLGTFNTPGGEVGYLMTKARLGKDEANSERRLTHHLVPFREVIPTKDLDFNQLLQRDLDDHRVAHSLVPYLLKPSTVGPAFFPPILAVMLPFDGQEPSVFPKLSEQAIVNDGPLCWKQADAGSHLRIRRLADSSGDDSTISLGQLWWNNEFSRIVVIDGQHRAMALLAIDRTIRDAWHENAAGSRYKYFYESRIKDLLGTEVPNLDAVEVPVTILWFEDQFGPGHEPHKAARKIFIDVNKEARTPSESRLILLSDTELVNIFTRSLLSELRNEQNAKRLPLFAVEYDNPDTTKTTASRWCALTNIHALRHMVNKAVFGPPRYIERVDVSIGKKEPTQLRDALMRKQLKVDKKLFNPTIKLNDGQEFVRDELGNRNFPQEAAEPLRARFQETWGAAILGLLSEIHPYAAHARALSGLHDSWMATDDIGVLAKDALFSGVGMYWTLRDSSLSWQSEKKKQPKPDVVKAWDLIGEKQDNFDAIRARELLGKKGALEDSNSLYQTVNTQACQLGLSLTLATLYSRKLSDGLAVTALADAMIKGINAWMLSRTKGAYDRRLCLAKNYSAHPWNIIKNMDTPKAIQFRYFWLEIICSPESRDEVSGLIDLDQIQKLLNIARVKYVDYIAKEKESALKGLSLSMKESDRKQQAAASAAKEIRQAITKWFGYSAKDLDTRFGAVDTSQMVEFDDELDEDAEGTDAL
jgi:hypothetical protein